MNYVSCSNEVAAILLPMAMGYWKSVEVRFHVSTADSTPALRESAEHADFESVMQLMTRSRHMKNFL